MSIEKTILTGLELLGAFGVLMGGVYFFEHDSGILDKIKNINGRRRIKKGLPPYNSKYEYGQLYLDFMKDHL